MGGVVALRLWGVFGVLGLVVVGVDGNWGKGLGRGRVDVVLVWEGGGLGWVSVWVLVVVDAGVGVKGVPWGAGGGVWTVEWGLCVVVLFVVVEGRGGIPWSSSSRIKSPGWGWGGLGPKLRLVAWEKVYGRGMRAEVLLGLRLAASRKPRM